MAWTGPAQGSTLRNKNLHDGGGMRNQAAIDIRCYVHHQSSLKNRASHPLKFIPLQPFCDTYKYSFWPRTIIDWNSLPSDYLTMDSTVKFKATISDYIVFSVMFTPFNLLYFDFYVSL